jgi:hypothetical protein
VATLSPQSVTSNSAYTSLRWISVTRKPDSFHSHFEPPKNARQNSSEAVRLYDGPDSRKYRIADSHRLHVENVRAGLDLVHCVGYFHGLKIGFMSQNWGVIFKGCGSGIDLDEEYEPASSRTAEWTNPAWKRTLTGAQCNKTNAYTGSDLIIHER